MRQVSVEEAAAELLGDPRPVLFLDTCDFLNVIEVAITSGVDGKRAAQLAELRAANRVREALAANPRRIQPVVTYVTAEEYAQKTDPTNEVYARDARENHEHSRPPAESARQFLSNLDKEVAQVHEVLAELGRPLASPGTYSDLDLVAGLKEVADALLDLCLVLTRHRDCVDGAEKRVLGKQRPSHKREVKDSLHLEHCLALAGRLRGDGFNESILFVSANTGDYAGTGKALHPELKPSFEGVTMRYFPSLTAAAGVLGLMG